MRHRLACGPKHAATREQGAHDHRAPLEIGELGLVEATHLCLAAGQDAEHHPDDEGRQQQELPIEAEQFRRPVETDIDDPRERVEVDNRDHAEQRDETARYQEQRLVDVVKAAYFFGGRFSHDIPHDVVCDGLVSIGWPRRHPIPAEPVI